MAQKKIVERKRIEKQKKNVPLPPIKNGMKFI